MPEITFIPPHALNTPVLFLVFNRLDTTKQVFEEIKEAKPPRLYIAADGAREFKVGEGDKVRSVRDYIMSNIDWECEVKTLFREKNLGCKVAVSSAIDWFFENEKMGIILEDDCLPVQSFFWFCEELLDRYKDDMRVGQISGDNFQKGIKRGDADYYFSSYCHVWGWASWRNRWNNYDSELSTFEDVGFIKEICHDAKTARYWVDIFKKMKMKVIDTWDYQWVFTLWKNKQLSITPNINLVKNIGFGDEATHTISDSEFSNLQAFNMLLYKHPEEVLRNYEADDFTSKVMFRYQSLFNRILIKIKKVIHAM
ncbi:glycosyltransferase family 2 protein [Sulfurovum sp.]|uniref:glycosyltransferase family 2 protein n=1 Tax=Sulfurovum sp. TaxID=1969726 RepID=UPI003567667A